MDIQPGYNRILDWTGGALFILPFPNLEYFRLPCYLNGVGVSPYKESANTMNKSIELGARLWYHLMAPFKRVSPNFFSRTNSISSFFFLSLHHASVGGDVFVGIYGPAVFWEFWQLNFFGMGFGVASCGNDYCTYFLESTPLKIGGALGI